MIGSSKPLSVSCHYDFINRIMHDKPSLSTLYPAGRNKSENKADLKKDQKWENYTDEDTLSLAMKYRDGAQFDRSRATFAIEKLFDLVAVRPSIRMKLIDQENLTAAGDGSCVHIHANRFGNKVKGAEDPDLDHRYSAPDANIGWDSDLGSWYYGYTLFNISVHNPVHKIDLPVFLAMGYASDHDALTSITATARMLDINPNLKPKHMCFDSAMDAYSIYEYLRLKDIIPVIDWNKRTSNPVNPYAKYENVDSDGVPLCTAGLRMIRDGYDNSKKATKYRCPVKAGKIHKCPLGNECSSSPYGRVKKTYDKTNYKLFGPIPYQSPKWKEIYKNRTCTERINNRILNDYGLHKMAVRNRSKNFFFSIMGAINIHLDAWHKVEG
ncbi:MAG: hypothetical protein J6E46_01110 [Faecalicoccus sp.]|nr:hypothetical protein [Faecalicoccus sp.]